MILRAVATVFFSAAAFGQTPRPAFEVASVKPAGPPPRGIRTAGLLQGGPGTTDPERITAPWITLQILLREAYGVDFDQIQCPGWLVEERYAIAAKVPAGATRQDLKLMFQDLLKERFKLELHHITKELPVYELTIAKSGEKLKENNEPNLSPRVPRDPVAPLDNDGFPQLPPGKSGMPAATVNGLTRMTAQGMPLSMLLFQVAAQLGTMTGPHTYMPGRIVDKTGLTGKYDFELEYAGGLGIGQGLSLPAGPDGEPSGGLGLIPAMEKQLGLKLTKTTAPYDCVGDRSCGKNTGGKLAKATVRIDRSASEGRHGYVRDNLDFASTLPARRGRPQS